MSNCVAAAIAENWREFRQQIEPEIARQRLPEMVQFRMPVPDDGFVTTQYSGDGIHARGKGIARRLKETDSRRKRKSRPGMVGRRGPYFYAEPVT